MLSIAVKSHWKLAFKTFIKAIKVTLQDINQIRKSRKYQNKIIDDLCERRNYYEMERKLWGK
ncbi:MAG: hypothetical protein QXH95_05140 [Thermoplasmata archaeon]